MKHKQLTQLWSAVALLLATATQTLHAFTYSDGDLLLVFRKATFSDVECNIGTASNYVGLANGTVRTVTNFPLATVMANFNNNLNGVTVSLLACTTAPGSPSSRAWVTDPDPSAIRHDVTGSGFNGIWSKVSYIGVQATNNGTFGSQTYLVDPTLPSSYSYIASGGGGSDASTLSGALLFPIEATIPATLRFWELHFSTVTPKPDSLQLGSFAIAANGTVTFTAGVGGGSSGPAITSNPTNVTVFAGGVASFDVGATGATGIQWQFNSVNIPGANGSSYSLTAHSTNAGGYRAIASNASGSSTSTVATLTVNLPAAATLGSVSQVTGGAFSLKLSGTANAYYQIQVNTNLNFSNAWTTIAFITNSGGATIIGDSGATNSPQRFYRAIGQ